MDPIKYYREVVANIIRQLKDNEINKEEAIHLIRNAKTTFNLMVVLYQETEED